MSPSIAIPLRSACRDPRTSLPSRYSNYTSRQFFGSLAPFTLSTGRPLRVGSNPSPPVAILARPFSSTRSSLSDSTPPVEHGVQLRPEPFSADEIKSIFGKAKVSPVVGNRVLAVLQSRREAGTLDLDLPEDITHSVRKPSLDAALRFLRANYPLDEDAAILARIEREEVEEEQKLIRRAEELGLYKPQSGTYDAERGEKDDPSGKSALLEFRKRNEARILEQEEKKRQAWLEGEQQDLEILKQQAEKNKALQTFENTTALEARPRADPQQRPLLAWIQKHHLRGMDNSVDVSQMTNARRIIPSLAITLLTIGLAYVFAQNYEPPLKQDRMFPDTPPAAATAMAIIGLNLGVYLLWKVPPAWRMLNRHFIIVNAWPRATSMIGSVFSHQTLKHLALNMGLLWFIGTRLHDDIGRGNFLALYMAAGALGSFTSLAAHTLLLKDLAATSLGASGAMSSLVAAWCMLHSNDKLTIFFLPREWQETFSAPGWLVLAGFVAFETMSMVAPFRAARFDHYAHLGGYLTGTAWALAWKAEQKKRREEKSWWEKLVSSD